MRYRNIQKNKTSIEVNNSYEGETIETKIERITTQNEPITEGAPLIFTERKNGVMPEYDPRTDRFDVAIEAMDAVTKTNIAKRENKGVEQNPENKENGKPESTQAT
nr:MAG: hypothetical protein [Microvirus sp.]